MSAIDKQLNNLINEYMPKRYYGHEARKYAKTIAIEYAKMCENQKPTSEPAKALDLFGVSGSDLDLSDFPPDEIINENDNIELP